jgi:hypothetical protein
MTEIVFWALVGAFIGWNIPQPFWARAIQDKIVSLWNRS